MLACPRQVSERIVSRAHFLLSLPSQATRVSIQEQSKRRWSILARLGGVGTMSKTLSQSNYLADGESLVQSTIKSLSLMLGKEISQFGVPCAMWHTLKWSAVFGHGLG